MHLIEQPMAAAIGAVDWECPLWRHFLGDAGYDVACQATLIPRVTEVQCRVWL